MALAEPVFEVGYVSPSACPACIMVPVAVQNAADVVANAPARVMLSLLSAHCARGITSIEATLTALPGVHSARVNLTLKRMPLMPRSM